MRIYLPATVTDLARAEGPASRRGHALTPELAEHLGTDDGETGEYHALLAAAGDALQMLDDRSGPLARVVVAADVDQASARRDDAAPSAIQVPQVAWQDVVALHIDDVEDAAAQRTLRAAAGGDAAALEDAGDIPLLWFDVTEREHVRAQF